MKKLVVLTAATLIVLSSCTSNNGESNANTDSTAVAVDTAKCDSLKCDTVKCDSVHADTLAK